VCIHRMFIWGMNVCNHFMCPRKMCVPFGQRLDREERWGKKKKRKRIESLRDTLVASSSFGPNPRGNRYQGGARGKRRGVSPGAAARPLDRTRVMRIVARGECDDTPLFRISGAMTLPSLHCPPLLWSDPVGARRLWG